MKMKLLLVFILLSTSGTLFAKGLSLAEKRAIAKIDKTTVKNFKKELNKLTDAKLKLKIDWESLSKPKMLHLYDEGLQKVYMEPLLRTLKNLSSDSLGRKALRDLIRSKKLKKITFSNKLKTISMSGITLKDGLLTIDQSSVTNVKEADIDTRAKAIYDALGV